MRKYLSSLFLSVLFTIFDSTTAFVDLCPDYEPDYVFTNLKQQVIGSLRKAI